MTNQIGWKFKGGYYFEILLDIKCGVQYAEGCKYIATSVIEPNFCKRTLRCNLTEIMLNNN